MTAGRQRSVTTWIGLRGRGRPRGRPLLVCATPPRGHRHLDERSISGGSSEAATLPAGPPKARGVVSFILRLLTALAIPIVAFGLLWATFDFLRDADANRFAVVGVAIVVGVCGVFFLYWAMNRVVDLLPERYREGVRPYVFVGPALVILGVFLVYPVINTLLISLKDAQGEGFVGLDNFKFVFTDESMLRAIRNTLGWTLVVPVVAVSIGLAFATLVDRLRRGEAVAKSLIFMPMAISFAGAAITWRLIYDFRPEGFGSNIGLRTGSGWVWVTSRWRGSNRTRGTTSC